MTRGAGHGTCVGTLAEPRELIAPVRRTHMAAIRVTRRPLADANAALRDLHDGKVFGRTIAIP